MNEKFPILSSFSWLLRAFAIIIVVVSLYQIPWREIFTDEDFNTQNRQDLLYCVLGLIIAMCLAVIGEVIGVLFAIEKNTRTFNQSSIKDLQDNPLKAQTSARPPAPTFSVTDEIPKIIISESKNILGVKETEIDKPLVQVLRVPPGEVFRFIDELEDKYGFVMTQQAISQIQTVEDIIQSIVGKEASPETFE